MLPLFLRPACPRLAKVAGAPASGAAVQWGKPGAVLGGKYARFHLLRYVFAVAESDELTSYSNQVTEAQRSIHTDISRNRRQYSEIRDSESRKNIAFENCSLNTHIGTYVAARNSPRCSGARQRDPERTRGRWLREAFQEMHAQDFELPVR